MLDFIFGDNLKKIVETIQEHLNGIIYYITTEVSPVMLLQFILFFPFINVIIVLFIFAMIQNKKNLSTNFDGKEFLYVVALVCSFISFVLSLYLGLFFQKSLDIQEHALQLFDFKFNLPFIFVDFLAFGLDYISYFFVILTNLFIFLCIYSINKTTDRLEKVLVHLFLLQFTVLGSFLCLDILGFFFFFEMSLIPIYFLVLV
jgi:NADH:ubiquinone oxidoreductase subunit 4 (subunit M)